MERKRYIDLHTHTFYSDGIGTPELNVKLARLQGIELLAITDHDKTTGYEEARIAGEKWQVQIIPGTEISTDKYHILGLGIDVNYPNFIKFLNYSDEEQVKICIKRIDNLRSRGVPITFDKVIGAFPKSRLGKMNIMYTLAADKECQEYFMKKDGAILGLELYNNYLRDIEGRYIDDKTTSINSERAIREIHAAGGIAVIAHPFKDVKDMVEMDELLKLGIDGLEIQPNFNGQNEPFRKYAREHNLLVTYGSDYHGGVFEREMLDNHGENFLNEDLARALKLN